MGQARRRDYSTSNAMRCLQDTQSFSTFFDKGWEHYVALIKRSLPLPLPMNDDLKTFWHSIYKAIEAPAKDLKPFSDGSDFVAYVEGTKGKLLVLIDDIDKLATASPLVYREFFRVLSVLHQSRPEFYAIAMGTWGIANLAITSSLVIDSQVPYFSRSQVEGLFYEFQRDDHFILDPNVVSDILSRSGGCVSSCSLNHP